jgi:hypothetical protein
MVRNGGHVNYVADKLYCLIFLSLDKIKGSCILSDINEAILFTASISALWYVAYTG